jgi:hypothetical protein
MTIKLFKMTSGEELIAKVTASDDSTFHIVDAVSLLYQQAGDGRMSVGFAPFMPYSEEKGIAINKHAVAVTSTPNAQILGEYNRVFSNIVIAPAGSI